MMKGSRTYLYLITAEAKTMFKKHRGY